MIPGFDLVQFAQSAGMLAAILVVAIVIFSESGLLIGFFLPGDSILFTLGILMQTVDGNLGFGLNIHLVVIFLFIAAALGDNVGYEFGKKVGPHIFKRPNSLLFKQENIQKAQAFYEKYGSKTIVLARFVPIVRTFAPIVAGVGKMKHSTFIIFNLIGAALWTSLIVYGGYFLGAWLTSIGVNVDAILLPIVFVIIIVSAIPALYQVLKTQEQRAAVWASLKSLPKKIKRKDKKDDNTGK